MIASLNADPFGKKPVNAKVNIVGASHENTNIRKKTSKIKTKPKTIDKLNKSFPIYICSVFLPKINNVAYAINGKNTAEHANKTISNVSIKAVFSTAALIKVAEIKMQKIVIGKKSISS